MSLWKPYSDEATTKKRERQSPVPDRLGCGGHPSSMSCTCPHSAPSVQDQIYCDRQPVGMYYWLPQQPNYTAPLAPISPEWQRTYGSGGYDTAALACDSHTSLPYQCQPNAPSPQDTTEPLEECRRHDQILDMKPISDDPEYQVFEREALRAMATKNGGSLVGNNPRMRRAVRPTNPNPSAGSYREHRERNNLAAKQSRGRRKLREVRLALQATYLTKKVAKLKARLAAGECGRCKNC